LPDIIASDPTRGLRVEYDPGKRGRVMTTKLALFNHKGGVSKTTTTFHLGWMLASAGHRVVLVDADPQCNLTGMILGLQGEAEFQRFYQNEVERNIRSGLAPAFESQPVPIGPVECVPVEGCEGLFLLPGHIGLSEWEVVLGMAQELSATLQTLQNLPGSLAYLLDRTAEKYSADFVLVDMNPSLSSFNQNLLMTSDYFLVPSSPDYFSLMAIESLSVVLPRWHAWSMRAQANPVLQQATYPFPKVAPRFLGTIIQKYRPRKGSPTEGFQKWIDLIGEKVSNPLLPALEKAHMALPDTTYARVPGLAPAMCLAQIADFNTLIAKSQEARVPVFALTEEQLGHVGIVLEGDIAKREEFLKVYSQLADRIETLMGDGPTA
jgi:cellulose biosynthesis protein BcsQ